MRGDPRASGADGDARSVPLLSAHGLERSFGEGATAVRALRGVDLEVSAGEMVAIMGPSGSILPARRAAHLDPLQALTYE
jgi:ABC-type microcin C transport system duplicated ATPase subunit YejF